MNYIFDEMINKINKQLDEWIAKKEFINVPKLFELAPEIKCFVIISHKGTGKTYSCMKYIVDNLKNKKFEAAWIRNTLTEFKESDTYASFAKIIADAKLQNNYIVKPSGVFYFDNILTKKNGIKKVLFAAVNTSYNTASQNAINNCKIIVYDEIINPQFIKPFLSRDLHNLFNTIQRNSDARICCFGNAHESDNDLLSSGFGIEFQHAWIDGKREIIYRPEQELLVIYLEKYYIEKSQKANEKLEKLFSLCEEVKNFNEGKVAILNNVSVKNLLLNKDYQLNFKPLFIYSVHDEKIDIYFVVGLYHKNVYVEQLNFFNKYDDLNLQKYCFRPQDKTPQNQFCHNNLAPIRTLISAYNQGILLFSKSYAKEAFIKLILPFLKILILQYEQKYAQK